MRYAHFYDRIGGGHGSGLWTVLSRNRVGLHNKDIILGFSSMVVSSFKTDLVMEKQARRSTRKRNVGLEDTFEFVDNKGKAFNDEYAARGIQLPLL